MIARFLFRKQHAWNPIFEDRSTADHAEVARFRRFANLTPRASRLTPAYWCGRRAGFPG